tara:strand:+ start:400 stop:684 length:285 start_codon:yes stop_codon:yes gene_type:complete
VSSKKIKSALTKKGFSVQSVEYIRNEPTPTGYGKGYDICFISEKDSFVEFEDLVFGFNPALEIGRYMQFDDFQQVMSWVNSLPDVNQLRKEQEK